MSEQINDDLFWTAVQYAAGDLPDEAASEFEQLLETEQPAREALAHAVALAEAVVQAEATTVVSATLDRSHRLRAAAWIVIATAACLALTFLYIRLPNAGGPADGNVAAAPTTAAQRQLAVAWVEGQSENGPATAAASMFDEEGDFELPVSQVEPSAPDWLIAALVDFENPPTRGEN